MIEIFKTLFALFNRKNIKKYLVGELELSEEELNKIQIYIEKTRIRQLEIGVNKRIRQLELRKIPFLKELSLDEVDFLLESNIDFDGILEVIYAKGGISKGLGSIEWSQDRQRYREKAKYAVIIFLVQTIFHIFLFIMLFFAIEKLKLNEIVAVALFCLWVIFVTFPMLFLWDNA